MYKRTIYFFILELGFSRVLVFIKDIPELRVFIYVDKLDPFGVSYFGAPIITVIENVLPAVWFVSRSTTKLLTSASCINSHDLIP